MSFLDELRWRGQLHQTTAEQPLVTHLAAPGRIAYAGFDPTSDSLTIGNLIPIVLLRRWQLAGHQPIALMGGGTGLIGDPSGRDEERSLMTRDEVIANVESQQRILEKFLDFDRISPNAARVVNNLDWLEGLGFIEMLRDVGKHFSVNEMIQRESVKRRLEQREHGISYTEFSYMLMQAYDFLHLKREMKCTVQVAGSDQFGNIVAGIDLIHREYGHDEPAFGITAPLVTRSDGKKMSKSSGDAIWLSADTEQATSPYQFYQYWINLPDADVGQWLKWYTMLDAQEIDTVLREHEAEPGRRIAQRKLAEHMTSWVHGREQLQRIEKASTALFSGDVCELDEPMLAEVFADVPSTTHDKSKLSADGGVSLVELLPQTTLASSKREAREFLSNSAISVNGERADESLTLTPDHLLHGRHILIRRGKKAWHATRWE